MAASRGRSVAGQKARALFNHMTGSWAFRQLVSFVQYREREFWERHLSLTQSSSQTRLFE